MKPRSILVFLSLLATTACSLGHGTWVGSSDGPGSSGAGSSSGSSSSSGSDPKGAPGTGVVKLTLRAK